MSCQAKCPQGAAGSHATGCSCASSRGRLALCTQNSKALLIWYVWLEVSNFCTEQFYILVQNAVIIWRAFDLTILEFSMRTHPGRGKKLCMRLHPQMCQGHADDRHHVVLASIPFVYLTFLVRQILTSSEQFTVFPAVFLICGALCVAGVKGSPLPLLEGFTLGSAIAFSSLNVWRHGQRSTSCRSRSRCGC
jgi:hypothetical protein